MPIRDLCRSGNPFFWIINEYSFFIFVQSFSLHQTTIYQGKNLNIKLAVKSDVGVDDPYAQGFKGFMIMVVDAATLKTEPLGVFSDLVTAGKTMDCPNAAKVKKIIWTVVESVLTFVMTRIVTLSFWIRGLWPTQTTISKSTSKLFGRRRPIT